MANLTSDRKTTRRDGALFSHPAAAATVVYSGALVAINQSGYAIPAADDATHTFAGKSDVQADNSAGINGDVIVEGHRSGVFDFNSSGMTQADLNTDAYVVDDNNVGRGIAAQPVNITGVSLKRIATSRGGSRALAFTATGTTLGYGGGSAVNAGAGGQFTLTATDGSQILATVTAGSLPVTDQSDSIQLRHVRAGRIVDISSATSVFVDIQGATRG
ncbi:MAG: hypothetical protein HZB29_13885 [Nitrospinae bacterium]|nr:hypothetical protein [Nitrospinota bacterium]